MDFLVLITSCNVHKNAMPEAACHAAANFVLTELQINKKPATVNLKI